MQVLVVNAGSSTMKLQVVGDDDAVRASTLVDPWDGGQQAGADAIDALLDDTGPVDAVGHRVVHGGELDAATRLTDDLVERLRALTPLAPLHQPRALVGIEAARARQPDVPHVACFDTAFHASMPPAARTYALPAAWRQRWGLQRYGFHGLSHAWAARRAVAMAGHGPASTTSPTRAAPAPQANEVPGSETNDVPASRTSGRPGAETSDVPAPQAGAVSEMGGRSGGGPASETGGRPGSETSDVPASRTSGQPGSETSDVPGSQSGDGTARRIVTCHLGAGASLCAVLDGRSVDTTMGFTPLEGLVMATRSGSVDPGLVLWLQRQAGLSADEVSQGLEREAGLAGLSGTSGDFRAINAAIESGDDAARLAVDVYVHRLRREIAAMVAALGGLDVLVFTGGAGEHATDVRAAACAGLGFLGVELDAARNAATTADGDITADGAAVRTVVVTAREDLEIARQVRTALA